MKSFTIATTMVVIAALFLPGLSLAQEIFADDFNRPDSADVGNGWENFPNTTGTLEVRDNELTSSGQDMQGGIFRPISLPAELRVAATLKEGGGDRSVPDGNMFSHDFRILNDGLFEHGYGIRFQRSGAGIKNSGVARLDGATVVNFSSSPFQFDQELQIDFTIHADGTIYGTVLEDANAFSFSFGPYNPVSSGSNFSFIQPFKSRRVGLDARMDDLVLTATLFRDGFETGDLTRWSSTLP